jgi:hypothetical protein
MAHRNPLREDYAAQHAPVTDPRFAMALWEERTKPVDLFLGQPEKVAHHHPRQFGSMNHASTSPSSKWVLTLDRGNPVTEIRS